MRIRDSWLDSAFNSHLSGSPVPSALWLALVALLVLTGCGSKSGVKATISQLEKAFPATAAAGPTAQATLGQRPLADADAYICSALAAVRSNDFAAAVVVLHGAARLPGLAPEQFIAVDQARKALITDLLNRAARGDTNAQAGLKLIEQAHPR
jgi:hypothetical protein